MLILQEFVIITITFSGVFLLMSYVGLTWTTKTIPSEMLMLAVTLISGSSAAALKKGELSNAEVAISKQSLRDYSFIGAATTELVLVVNYVFLIYLEKSIPIGLSPAIGVLGVAVLAFTDFGSKDTLIDR